MSSLDESGRRANQGNVWEEWDRRLDQIGFDLAVWALACLSLPINDNLRCMAVFAGLVLVLLKYDPDRIRIFSRHRALSGRRMNDQEFQEWLAVELARLRRSLFTFSAFSLGFAIYLVIFAWEIWKLTEFFVMIGNKLLS